MSTRSKTYRQVRHIFFLAKVLNISIDDVRKMVSERFPETGGHISLLSVEQASKIIDELRRKAGLPVEEIRKRKEEGEGVLLASSAQIYKMKHLARELLELMGDEPTDENIDALLNMYAEKFGGIDYKIIDTRRAGYMINALIASIERKKLKKGK